MTTEQMRGVMFDAATELRAALVEWGGVISKINEAQRVNRLAEVQADEALRMITKAWNLLEIARLQHEAEQLDQGKGQAERGKQPQEHQ